MGRTVKLLLYYFAYQLAIYGIFVGIYMLVHGSTEMPDPTDSSYVTFLLGIQVVYNLAFGMHLLGWKYVKLDKMTWAHANSGKLMGTSFVFIIGLGLWNNYLSELVNLPNSMQDFFEDMMTHPLGILATVIMAPIVEELFFRGAIQGHLMRKWNNPVWAIFISSLIFGGIHANPAQIPFAFTIGLALGWMYYVTGSLVPGIFMHFINNGTAVLTFLMTKDPEAGMIELFGSRGALGLALLGVVITVVCVRSIHKQMLLHPVEWKSEEDNV